MSKAFALFAVPVALAGIAPGLSTQALGIHYCDPLRYSTIGFASLMALGLIIYVTSMAACKPEEVAATAANPDPYMGVSGMRNAIPVRMPSTPQQSKKDTPGCAVFGGFLAFVGFMGTVSCLLAGYGMIPQEILQETLTGRLFMLNGVAPVALERGAVVGVDIAFFVGGMIAAGVIAGIAIKAASCCGESRQIERN